MHPAVAAAALRRPCATRVGRAEACSKRFGERSEAKREVLQARPLTPALRRTATRPMGAARSAGGRSVRERAVDGAGGAGFNDPMRLHTAVFAVAGLALIACGPRRIP
ncbi:MAG TPA: hypothetical protein VF400_02350, partial [Anaeromyxobacteraceae bacterium]